MQRVTIRPKLHSFRVEAFNSENRTEGSGTTWKLELKQEIQIGLAVPVNPGFALQAVVRIELQAMARAESEAEQAAAFKGEYLAKFNFSDDATEAAITELIDQEHYQYVLVAQVFPLAMTHFRRELQATGFDGRELPLGI